MYLLELKNVSKVYHTAGFQQRALDKINIQFRECEFVSILGQSGSGKTTMLNIIGGLDNYTSGDLIINGVSTKKYKDRDWDTYRNHSIGFVFQSYNLIPHQTALANVELALTLSGVGKEERRKRAKAVLKKVGLQNHMNKKPNQMSGGQMQRIAIARALINDPDILLADEPTGALDSETSVQIMELLKEIAKEKLVIMVTHNPELANKYSTRIVKLLDGQIMDDSNPVKESEKQVDEEKKEKTKNRSKKKTSMSFMTAFSLSLNNLMTKKGRTILTAFAGSIGIIGIALILSLSSGVKGYISRVEEDTLSSYPLSIEEQTVDTSSMIMSLMTYDQKREEHELDKIYSGNIMTDLINTLAAQMETNNLEEFKKYLDNDKNNFKEYTTAIEYGYHIDLQLYKSDTSNDIVRVNPTTILSSLGVDGMDSMMELHDQFGGGMASATNVFQELLDNKELLKTQYDMVAGRWPAKYNEVVLMIDEHNEISDYALYALGVKDQKELNNSYKNILEGKEIESKTSTYSYDDFLNMTFKLVLNTDYYEKQNNVWLDKREDDEYLKQLIDYGEEVKIVGIIRPNEESLTTSTTGSIGYLKDLTEYVIGKINESEIAKEQKANPEINVFTGFEFSDGEDTFDMKSLTQEQQAYLAGLSQEELAKIVSQYTSNAKATYEDNLSTLGIVDLEKPSAIYIYPKDFDSKEVIIDKIESYNNQAKEEEKEELVINYTDIVGAMMTGVSSIIDTISYVLIAFVAISLIVSSIMIGIITYISVLERTKEIGILRAMGASKKDVSRVFNAETLIEGLTAGVIGILVTILLNIPVNIIIKKIVNISNISSLPIGGAIILVMISIFLTVIAGVIPSRMASKKDPVEALRME